MARTKRRGRLEYILNASIWIGSYFLVRLLHLLSFDLGWAKSPGTTSILDVVIWTATGLIVGEIDGTLWH